jgi:hypothetical protein
MVDRAKYRIATWVEPPLRTAEALTGRVRRRVTRSRVAHAPASREFHDATVARLRERSDVYGFGPVSFTSAERSIIDDALREKRIRERI